MRIFTRHLSEPGLPCESGGRHRAVLRRRLSEPPGALADRFRRRRPGRYRGADHEPVAVGAFRPAVRGREPRRLRRQYRGRRGGQLAAGRLYAVVRRAQQRDLDLALQASVLRFHPRHRAGREHHATDQYAGGVERHAGQDRSGIHRLLQGQSGQDLLCLVGLWHLGAHVGGTVQGDDQVRHGACALSRIGDRVSRHHFQQGAVDLRQPARRRSSSRAPAPCARSASPRRSAGPACPIFPPSPRPCRDSSWSASTASPRPRARRRRSSISSTRRSARR